MSKPLRDRADEMQKLADRVAAGHSLSPAEHDVVAASLRFHANRLEEHEKLVKEKTRTAYVLVSVEVTPADVSRVEAINDSIVDRKIEQEILKALRSHEEVHGYSGDLTDVVRVTVKDVCRGSPPKNIDKIPKVTHRPIETSEGDAAHGCEICDGDDYCTCPKQLRAKCLGCGGKWPECDPDYKKK